MRKFSGSRLVVATSNVGKLEEIADLLRGRDVHVQSMADFGLESPAETESTFIGNARIKAVAAACATGLPCLADDSGLEIDALGGQPGIFTADWAETGAGRDFDFAMARVHDQLMASGASVPWKARFVCALVLAWPDGHTENFEGRIEGEIVWPGRGTEGHGYDPIFRPEGSSATFGEMDRWKKNRISHRARAFEALSGCFT